MELLLPGLVNAEGLLPFLAQLDIPEEHSEIVINFAELRRVSPAGLVALTAAIRRWQAEKRMVILRNLGLCAISGYLQRMDVLKLCGVEMTENFTRHDASGRFVPVRLVDADVNQLGVEGSLHCARRRGFRTPPCQPLRFCLLCADRGRK
jgi:hypothetical protein